MGAFLDPSDSYFLFADLVGFNAHWTYMRGYHKWALAHSSSCSIWIVPLLRGHLSYKATFSLSQRWPLNTGLTIFDFVGMMIESMAGKSASLHGTCYDATPFTYTEDTPPIDYMGKTLSAGRKSFFSNEASACPNPWCHSVVAFNIKNILLSMLIQPYNTAHTKIHSKISFLRKIYM